MTNTNKKDKPKPKIQISRRETTGKKKPDLFAKFRNTEHPLDNVIPNLEEPKTLVIIENPQVAEDTGTLPSHTSQSRHTSQPSMPTQTSQPSHTRQSEPDVKKSYQKVPNSISKKAIPEGLFKPGKSKHLYDVLLGLTRADIVPKFSIRLSKTKLRKLAGIGSRVTFDSCVEHLESVGLIKVDVRSGEHEGNIFEVFFPEEVTLTRHTRHTSLTSQPSHAQNLDRLVSLESSQTSQTQTPVNIEQNDALRLSFKTNKSDDEAFAQFNEIFQNISRKLHGKDLKDLPQTAKVLVTELERLDAIKPITDIDAFLAEHLRRLVARVPETKKGKIKDTVGTPKLEFNLERELATLRELVEIDGLETVLASIEGYDFTE